MRVAWADFRLRYAGSGFGALWHLFVPAAQITIYATVFSSLMEVRAPGRMEHPYAFVLYLCSGLFPWFAFSGLVISGSETLVNNARYLSKLSIPEEVFVAQAALAELFTLTIYLLLLMATGILLDLPPQWTWLLLPAVAVLFHSVAFGLALLLATLRVFFPDLRHVLTIGMHLWLWLTPIVYLESALPETFAARLRWNPIYWFFSAYRQLFLQGEAPSLGTWAAMLAWAAVFVGLGALVLNRLRGEIRDVL